MSNEKPIEKPARKQYVFVNQPFMKFEAELNLLKSKLIKEDKQADQQQPS